MFELARLSLSVSNYICSGIILSPRLMEEGAALMNQHGHSKEEAMSYVLVQSFLNNYISTDDLTDEGRRLLNYGSEIMEGAFEKLDIPIQSFEYTYNMAESGDANAQYNLGSMYKDGERVQQDISEAIKWYRKSAEQGFTSAQYNLGSAYEELGAGVPQDYVQAYAWYNIASSQGAEVAGDCRDKLKELMTKRQVEKAQELSKEYYENFVIT